MSRILKQFCLSFGCAIVLSSCGGGSGHSDSTASPAVLEVVPTIQLEGWDERYRLGLVSEGQIEEDYDDLYTASADEQVFTRSETTDYYILVEDDVYDSKTIDLKVLGSDNRIYIGDRINVRHFYVEGEDNYIEFGDSASVENIVVTGDMNDISVPETVTFEYEDAGYDNEIITRRVVDFQTLLCDEFYKERSVSIFINGGGHDQEGLEEFEDALEDYCLTLE